MPCVSLGKSPQRPRVGIPKLDIIHDQQWDVYVDVSVENDVWREERICQIDGDLKVLIDSGTSLEHDVAYTRMI